MGIDIRPDPVNDAGDAMTEIAELAGARIDDGLQTSLDAANAHPGWESSGALTETTQAWENHLGQLVFQVGQLGDRLHTSAADYTRADAEAARGLQAVLDLMTGS